MYRAVVLRQPQEAAAIAVRVGLPMAIVDRETCRIETARLFLALGVAFLVALTPECLVGAQHH